jgi:anti-anti-sigma regulatory factor
MTAACQPGVRVVIADLSVNECCDSSGIRQLVLAHRRLNDIRAELRVVVQSDAVLRVLQVVGQIRP